MAFRKHKLHLHLIITYLYLHNIDSQHWDGTGCCNHSSWTTRIYLSGPIFRRCSANHKAGYWSNLPCDWPSIVWAYSGQETEYGPCMLMTWGLLNIQTPSHQYRISYYEDNKVSQLPYHYNGNPYTWKDCLFIESRLWLHDERQHQAIIRQN